MTDEKIKELIVAIIEENSGGLKLMTLVTELVSRGVTREDDLFGLVTAINGVKVLEYVWHGRPKYFIYIA